MAPDGSAFAHNTFPDEVLLDIDGEGDPVELATEPALIRFADV